VLVGDDRVHLEASNGLLVVRPALELTGLIEIRGLGIRRCDFAEDAIVGFVVDLGRPRCGNALPEPEALRARICGVEIPRIPVGASYAALPLVLAALTMTESSAFYSTFS